MRRSTRALLALTLALAAGLRLTGPVLRAGVGQVVIVEDLGEQIDASITAIETDATLAACIPSGILQGCTYVINGETVSSSVAL